MIEQLLSTLETECNYQPGDTLLVGVSGGADSLALLHGLHSQKVFVIAAHLDHSLRIEASEDRQFVEEVTKSLGVPFVSKMVDVRAFAEKQKLSVEEAGRVLRYKFLFEQADKLFADAVVVAHTADDQVETVLMHLLRGAGLEGLSGMNYSMVTHWHEHIPLYRPMLKIWRKEIDAYCTSLGLEPLEDQSNLDVTFYRNRIRHELIPMLKQYNPGIKTALWKTANTIHGDREVLERLIEDYFRVVVNMDFENSVLDFKRTPFLALHQGVQRRLIRLGIHRMRPDIRDIGFDEVEKVIRFVVDPPRSGEAEMFQGLSLRIGGESFLIFPSDKTVLGPGTPQFLAENGVLLQIPGSIEISIGWEIVAERLNQADIELQEMRENQDQNMAFVDFNKIQLPLSVKRRLPGALFSPLGMAGKRIKVSDFLINEKMPKSQRDHWPLVYSGGELIWIPGHRIADRVRITSETELIVKLTMKKNG